MSAPRLPGYTIPFHRSLAEPILLGGVPRGLAIVNGTVAAAIGLGLQQWLAGLILWIGAHSLAAFAARRDPEFLGVATRHLRQRSYFSC